MFEDEDLSEVDLTWELDTNRSLADLGHELLGLRQPFLRALALLETIGQKARGKIPRWAFETLPRIIPQFSIELAVLRPDASMNADRHEVFLIQRPNDDPYWPGELHIPGTTMYMLDDEASMWKRLLDSELLVAKDGRRPAMKTQFAFHMTTTRAERARGPGMHAVFYAWVPPGTTFENGVFYPMRTLPTNTIGHHRRMIGLLVDHLRT